VTLESAVSRASFAGALADESSSGAKSLLLAPLGAGKTHTLAAVRDALLEGSVPFVFVDLFTAASTPEHLLETLGESVAPFMEPDAAAIRELLAEGARDRHRSSSALLRLFDLLATRRAGKPFVWLVDEVTEIRSLAYFPELGRVEEPFARALGAARGAVLTTSYLGLAVDLFPDFARQSLPPLSSRDLEAVPSLRSDSDATAAAIVITHGCAATLLPLVADMRESRDLERSLVVLLRAGGPLEIVCRRHYEVLLLRSRGYAVAKRTAEVVAAARDQRLTDLFPHIGRTAGASRQYLRWLVEVGLLVQAKKRYDFADPVVGLWATLYLGRADQPSDAEIRNAVRKALASGGGVPTAMAESPEPVELPKKRVDRFEEID